MITVLICSYAPYSEQGEIENGRGAAAGQGHGSPDCAPRLSHGLVSAQREGLCATGWRNRLRPVDCVRRNPRRSLLAVHSALLRKGTSHRSSDGSRRSDGPSSKDQSVGSAGPRTVRRVFAMQCWLKWKEQSAMTEEVTYGQLSQVLLDLGFIEHTVPKSHARIPPRGVGDGHPLAPHARRGHRPPAGRAIRPARPERNVSPQCAGVRPRLAESYSSHTA